MPKSHGLQTLHRKPNTLQRGGGHAPTCACRPTSGVTSFPLASRGVGQRLAAFPLAPPGVCGLVAGTEVQCRARRGEAALGCLRVPIPSSDLRRNKTAKDWRLRASCGALAPVRTKRRTCLLLVRVSTDFRISFALLQSKQKDFKRASPRRGKHTSAR